MKQHKKRGILASVAAAGTALLLAFSGATAASAEPGANGPLILPGAGGEQITGNVTVHKHEQSIVSGTAGNGLEDDDVTGANIAGVTFVATQILGFEAGGIDYEIDLTTNEGWQLASQLQFTAPNTWTFDGDVATIDFDDEFFTDNTGPAGGTYVEAFFENLPVGLYHFEETAYPAGVTPSAPWIMTVPLTHPTELNSWLYDIHVYPKNSTTSVEKTVQDAGATKVGDNVTWTISADVPKIANPDGPGFLPTTRYQIQDVLDPRLDLSSVTVALEGAGALVLEADDYDVTPASVPAVAPVTVDVIFTEQGRAKLATAAASASPKVVVSLVTVVNSTNELDEGGNVTGDLAEGVIKNQAVLFPNQPSFDDDEPTRSNVPETRFGDILLEKVDINNGEALAGATFRVYTSEADAQSGANFITIDGQTDFVTGADGKVLISGLRASDWANNAPAALGDDGFLQYWIVETVAPVGYELLAEPLGPITITSSTTSVERVELTVDNVPHNAGFELPLTGGMGTALFTIAGIAILGAVLFLARRRRNNLLSAAE